VRRQENLRAPIVPTAVMPAFDPKASEPGKPLMSGCLYLQLNYQNNEDERLMVYE
jgi:hypothetical protein